MLRILTIILSLSVLTASASATEAKLENLQAAFIYKFTNYIEWPSTEKKPFQIAVLNNPEMHDAIAGIFDGKLIANRPVTVLRIGKLPKNAQFDILHISHMDAILADDISRLQTQGLLVITGTQSGSNDEAIIHFYLDRDEKIRFEINNEKAKSRGLKINSRLLNLSKSSK